MSVTDRSFILFAKAVKVYRKLRKLTLNFSSCVGITDNGFEPLCESLSEPKSLKEHYFDFTRSQISNLGLEKMTATLEGLSILESIVLHFNSCANMNNQGIEAIIK
jgi:hypothetical protein